MLLKNSARALLIALTSVAVHSQPQPPAQYGIKDDHAHSGSSIRRYAVKPISIPINRSWAELSLEDRKKWNNSYEEIKDGDEPPFPIKGLKAVIDPIRRAQAKLLVQGRLFLVATVGRDGKIEEVKSYGVPNTDMANFASRVLLITPFKPAICGNEPCRMDFPLCMDFVVE